MPFFSTLPTDVQPPLALGRFGTLLHSCVNDDNDIAAGVDGGKPPASWGDVDGEDEIDIEARGGSGFLRKLGRRSGEAETIGVSGTNATVSRVVAFASTTSNVEIEPLLVASKSLLVLEGMVDRGGGEPDGREGTGGMGVVGGFLGICLTEFRLLFELEGVEVGPPGGGLSL